MTNLDSILESSIQLKTYLDFSRMCLSDDSFIEILQKTKEVLKNQIDKAESVGFIFDLNCAQNLKILKVNLSVLEAVLTLSKTLKTQAVETMTAKDTILKKQNMRDLLFGKETTEAMAV
jgi:hypothetical protein